MPHHEQPPPAMLPGTYVMDQATVDRLVTSAAMAAAKAVAEETPNREDIEEIAEKTVNAFLFKVFDIAPEDAKALIELRKDFTAMRAARETREALVQHGIKAVLTVLLGGVCTAIWLAIKGAK